MYKLVNVKDYPLCEADADLTLILVKSGHLYSLDNINYIEDGIPNLSGYSGNYQPDISTQFVLLIDDTIINTPVDIPTLRQMGKGNVLTLEFVENLIS